MPVSNDDDTGTVVTVGRPRPTLTYETQALYSSAVATGATALLLARYGVTPLTLIAFVASFATFGLLAFDIGRRGGKGRGVKKSRSLVAAVISSNSAVDFSAYDFGPFVKLEVKQTEPLPPDFGPDCIVVFYDSTGTFPETWITGVVDASCLIRYINHPNKGIAGNPDHIAVSP